MKTIDLFKFSPIVPVVKIEDEKKAVPLVKSLINGGIQIIEITFRSEAAEQAIKNVRQEYPDFMIGAGTVLTIDQVQKAVKAGANFIVSPGSDIEIMEYCRDNNIPHIPGCITPSEIQVALSYGFTVQKFFPAEAFNGIKTLKAIFGPFPQVSFVCTGGINEENISEYLELPNVVAVAGTWMAKNSMISNNDFAKITELSKISVEKIKK